MRRSGRAALVALLLALASPAAAHHLASGDTRASGVPIASLTHGQMAVVARNAAAILALAGRPFPTDEAFRRLLNFANIQKTLCLWGLMPGAVSDEASPFNECSHAYLAATRELLAHMAGMPGRSAAAAGLAEAIDREMIAAGAPVLCRYSDEDFNTAALVYPRPLDIASHPLSLALLALPFAAALAGALEIALRRRQRT